MAPTRFARAIRLDNLLDQGNEAIGVLVLANVVRDTAGPEVDGTKAIALDVLARGRDLALPTALRPTAHDARQQVQIDLVFEQEGDLTLPGFL